MTSYEKLLSQLDTMSYTERSQHASLLAQTEPDVVDKLVQMLRDHPAAAPMQVDSKQGVTELLPAQSRTLAPYFHEYQASLNIAASANLKQVFVDEIRSPSTFFTKKAARELTKPGRFTDDELLAEVLAAVPFVRRRLVHAIVRRRRTALCDRLFVALSKQFGLDEASAMIHACSSSVVSEAFQDVRLFDSRDLRWSAICQHHSVVVIDLIERDLQRVDASGRARVWREWAIRVRAGIANLRKSKPAMEKLFDLWLRLAPKRWYGKGKAPRDDHDQKDQYFRPESVDLVQKLWPGIVAACPDRVLDYIEECASISEDAANSTAVSALFKRKNFSKRWLDMVEYLHYDEKHALVSALPIRDYVFYYRNIVIGGWKKRNVDFSDTSAASRNKQSSLTVFIKAAALELFGRLQSELVDTTHGTWDQYDKQPNYSRGASRASQEDATAADRARRDSKRAKLETKLIVPLLNDFFGFVFAPLKDIKSRAAKGGMAKNADGAVLLYINLKDIFCSWSQDFLGADSPLVVVECLYDHFAKIDLWTPPESSTTQAYSEWHSEFKNWHQKFTQYYGNKYKALESTRARSEREQTEYCELRAKFFARYEQLWHTEFQAALQLYKLFPTEKVSWPQTALTNAPTSELKKFVFKNLPEKAIAELAKPLGSDTTLLKSTPASVRHALATRALEKVANVYQATELAAFLPIADKQRRQLLEKATDSASAADRRTAMRRLIEATHADGSLSELLKTVRFVRDKIRNEAPQQRSAAISALTFSGQPSIAPQKLFPECGSAELFAQYDGLLHDVLEAGDGGDSDCTASITSQLLSLAERACSSALFALTRLSAQLAAPDADSATLAQQQERAKALFAFGASMQYRVAVHQMGESGAAQSFVVAGVPQLLTAEMARVAFPLYFDTHKQLLPESVVAKRADSLHESFFELCGPCVCIAVPQMHKWLEGLLETVESSAPRDNDNLYVINKRGRMMAVFKRLQKDMGVSEPRAEPRFSGVSSKSMASVDADEVGVSCDVERCAMARQLGTIPEQRHFTAYPLMRRYVDLVMHSRLYYEVYNLWADALRRDVKRENEALSPRALNRAVKARIVEGLLAISKSAIYKRMVWSHLVLRRQDLLDQFVGTSGATFRGVFYVAPHNRTFVKTKFQRAAREHNEGDDGDDERYSRANLAARENAADEKAKQNATELGDHPDQYILEACYGLRRLLPRQCAALGKQWYNQIFNRDRAQPERMASARRWTLMPSTTFTDIVEFIDAHKEEVSGSVVDIMYRGLTITDERLAPLRYLFSRKVLESKRVTAAMAASAAVINLLPPSGLTGIVESIMDDPKIFRVTIMKQCVRLLMAQPEEGVDAAINQWNKKDLHRDVRIALLKCALRLLRTSKHSVAAWKVIAAAVASRRTELLIAVLGATNGSISVQLPPLVSRPRFRRYLETLPKIVVPMHERARFVDVVLLPLIKADDVDPDIHALATGVLGTWAKFVQAEPAVELLKQVVATIAPGGSEVHTLQQGALRSQTLLTLARVYQSARNVVKLCGCSHTIDFAPAKRDHVLETLLIVSAAAMNCPHETQRNDIIQVLTKLLGQLPVEGVSKGQWNLDEERAFMAPLYKVKPVFGYEAALMPSLVQRRVGQLNLFSDDGDAEEECMALLQNALQRYEDDGTPKHEIASMMQTVFSRKPVITKVLDHLLHLTQDDAVHSFVRSYVTNVLIEYLIAHMPPNARYDGTLRVFTLQNFDLLKQLLFNTKDQHIIAQPREASKSGGFALASLLEKLVKAGSDRVRVHEDDPHSETEQVLQDSLVRDIVERELKEALAIAAKPNNASPYNNGMCCFLMKFTRFNNSVIIQLGAEMVLDVVRLRAREADRYNVGETAIGFCQNEAQQISQLVNLCESWPMPIPGELPGQPLEHVISIRLAYVALDAPHAAIENASKKTPPMDKCSDMYKITCFCAFSTLATNYFYISHPRVLRDAYERAQLKNWSCADTISVGDRNKTSAYSCATAFFAPDAALANRLFTVNEFYTEKPHLFQLTIDVTNWLLDKPSQKNMSADALPFVIRKRVRLASRFVGRLCQTTRDAKTKKLPAQVTALLKRTISKSQYLTGPTRVNLERIASYE